MKTIMISRHDIPEPKGKNLGLMTRWCTRMFGPRRDEWGSPNKTYPYKRIDYTYHVRFQFLNKEDAALFVLTWL